MHLPKFSAKGIARSIFWKISKFFFSLFSINIISNYDFFDGNGFIALQILFMEIANTNRLSFVYKNTSVLSIRAALECSAAHYKDSQSEKLRGMCPLLTSSYSLPYMEHRQINEQFRIFEFSSNRKLKIYKEK